MFVDLHRIFASSRSRSFSLSIFQGGVPNGVRTYDFDLNIYAAYYRTIGDAGYYSVISSERELLILTAKHSDSQKNNPRQLPPTNADS